MPEPVDASTPHASQENLASDWFAAEAKANKGPAQIAGELIAAGARLTNLSSGNEVLWNPNLSVDGTMVHSLGVTAYAGYHWSTDLLKAGLQNALQIQPSTNHQTQTLILVPYLRFDKT